MKHQKEVSPILTALFCLNRTGENDPEVNLILDYAFRRFFGSSTNLLTLCCAGKSRADIWTEVEKLLQNYTEYQKYKEGKL